MSADRGIPYVASLDGLRALAVAAVVIYHADLGVLPGGFLGVSLFFTLSGYLITTLLLAEHAKTGRIDLRGFVGRRIRRLMPASLVCLAMVLAALAAGFGPEMTVSTGDVMAVLGYSANWHSIVADRSYAELFAEPSPLLHFWSLAIEEQFYVVFPLLAALLLRHSPRVLGWVALALAGGSALAAYASPSVTRSYYGTDTRASELLVGVCLAIVAPALRRAASRAALRGVALASSIVLGVLLLAANEDSGWLNHGGFALVALLNAGLVTGSMDDRWAPGFLRSAALRWVGKVSYGLYLFHWPVFVFLTPEHTGLATGPLVVVELAVTCALAALSYRFVEFPVRARRVLPHGPTALMAGLLAATTMVVAATYLPARGLAVAEPARDAMPKLLARPIATGEGEPTDGEAVASSLAPTSTTSGSVSTDSTTQAILAPPMPAEAVVRRPLRVLVLGSPLTDEVRAALSPTDVLDYTLARCPIYQVVEVDAGFGPTPVNCPDFRSAWLQAINAEDPDAIVMSIGHLERVPFVRAGDTVMQTGVLQYHQSSTEVRSAADLVAEFGVPAVVFDAVSGDARFGDGEPLALGVVRSTAALDEFVELAELARAAAESEAPEPTQQTEPTRPLRVLVVGDSTSIPFAEGLSDVGDERFEFISGGRIGCPFARAARVRPIDNDGVTAEDCPLVEPDWRSWIEAMEPDVIVLVITGSILWDHTLVADGNWVRIGDEAFEAAYNTAAAEAATLAGEFGIPLLVTDVPPMGKTRGTDADDPARATAANELITAWSTRHESLRVLPYAAYFAPADSKQGRRERPDGVHPTREVIAQIGVSGLLDALAEASR